MEEEKATAATAAAAAATASMPMPTPEFDMLDIPADLLRGIFGYGFEKPSSIQQQAIVPILEGKNIVAQAQSGTGKTGAFSIGALGRVDLALKETQILILAPTRISNTNLRRRCCIRT